MDLRKGFRKFYSNHILEKNKIFGNSEWIDIAPQAELISCPFCGSEHNTIIKAGRKIWIECRICNCRTPNFKEISQAIGRWNKRAILYECDRQKDCNKSSMCGNECKATADIVYAKNFVFNGYESYIEKTVEDEDREV